MNQTLMEAAGFKSHVDLVNQRRCPICSEFVRDRDSTDELSREECTISGMCQKCQDNFFKYDHTKTNEKEGETL